jgi:RNA polymerase sigma-70 factor (ECF subfamily)
MDDGEIIAGIRKGDQACIKALLDQYGDRLLRSAFLLCQNDTDAEDLVQDTVIQAVKSIPHFAGTSSLYTWLHGILLNKSRHYGRSRVRRKMLFTDRVADENMEGAQVAINPEVMREASHLADALRRLSPAHREVVILRFFEGMKLEDIALHLNANSSTIRSRLRHALRLLGKIVPHSFNEIPLPGNS